MDIQSRELHRVVPTALVYKSDLTYLVTKRAPHKKVHPNKWTIPGGGMEIDDYINTEPSTKNSKQWYGVLDITLIREIREEVNLEIGAPEYFENYTFIRPDGIPVLGLSFFAQYKGGEVKLDEDSVDFKWIKVEEVDQFDFIDGVGDEIKAIDQILKKLKLG